MCAGCSGIWNIIKRLQHPCAAWVEIHSELPKASGLCSSGETIGLWVPSAPALPAEVTHTARMSTQHIRLQGEKAAILGSQPLPAPAQELEEMSGEGMRKAQACSESVPQKFHPVAHGHHVLEMTSLSLAAL